MKIKVEDLLDDLKIKTLKMIGQVESFQKMHESDLNYKSADNKWSILECIGHLNLYSDFYVNEFERRILSAKHTYSEVHKTGFIGNRLAKFMLPIGDEISMKMKTFNSKNPENSKLSITTLDKFIKQQIKILLLVDKSRTVNLTKTKCSITIKGIKLRFGDALRFYIFHNVRHIKQATKIIEEKFQLQ